MPLRPCPRVGCPHLVNLPERPCPLHGDEIRNRRLQRDRERAPEKARIYDADWRRLRREHLAREPACRGCGATENLEVHHIRSVRERPDLRLSSSNLATVCNSCHSRVTRATGR